MCAVAGCLPRFSGVCAMTRPTGAECCFAVKRADPDPCASGLGVYVRDIASGGDDRYCGARRRRGYVPRVPCMAEAADHAHRAQTETSMHGSGVPSAPPADLARLVC